MIKNMARTKEWDLNKSMDILLQSAEESYLLGDDDGYELICGMVYDLYAMEEIPLHILERAENRLDRVKTIGTQDRPCPRWKVPEKEVVYNTLRWLKRIGKRKGKALSEFEQARRYISDYWNSAWT